MDVRQARISVAVRDAAGKLVMESVIETKATTILEFVRGLNGSLYVAFEEGTSTAWLHDLRLGDKRYCYPLTVTDYCSPLPVCCVKRWSPPAKS